MCFPSALLPPPAHRCGGGPLPRQEIIAHSLGAPSSRSSPTSLWRRILPVAGRLPLLVKGWICRRRCGGCRPTWRRGRGAREMRRSRSGAAAWMMQAGAEKRKRRAVRRRQQEAAVRRGEEATGAARARSGGATPTSSSSRRDAVKN
jgi:hypothetical protein